MILPQRDYRATKITPPEKLHRGLDRTVDQLVGKVKRRRSLISRWRRQADEIIEQSSRLRGLSEEQLQQRLLQVRTVYRRSGGAAPEESFIEALQLITEASERTLGIRPYSVQIVAAIAIQHGYLAEMATGEGKTLTAGFPAILTAWSAKPCHIVTANDYLAARDAETLTPLYAYCSATTGWIDGEMTPVERRRNYARDIVYTTGKELLADFLRDRLSAGGSWNAARWQIRRCLGSEQALREETVMRGIDTAIIDEADSVLIDEAVTPLIISQPQANRSLTEACLSAREIAEALEEGSDFRVDRHYREITLTESGRARLAELSPGRSGLFGAGQRREELILTALIAKQFYRRGQQYVIEADKVVIVDEFTGRMMPDRSWRQGLHQAVEAGENLPLSDPSETLAQLSFQNFFRLFRKLSGLTGTARETAEEFWDIYRLPVLPIPTNKPCQRKTFPQRFFPDQQGKWQAICAEIAQCRSTGQPVLVGTRSVAASEKLAGMLDDQSIPYQLLNAIKHREEAAIISAAGERGRVTIATNMAGRGADIKLGPGVAELGGLHVILSEQHESKRIDRQLQGRCARQGEPGSVRNYVSLDDPLLRDNLSGPILHTVDRWFAPQEKMKYIVQAVTVHAQKKAQRKTFRQRKAVLESDEWLNKALSFASPGALFQ